MAIHSTSYTLYKGESSSFVDGGVIAEALVCVYVNGQELATFMCTPMELDELALGFLRSEGFIRSLDDVELLTLAENGTCVDVWLKEAGFSPPSRRIVTSGCGGGITFDDLSESHPPVDSPLTISPEQVAFLMKQLHLAAKLYNEVRGVHTSALSDGQELLLVAQDVGRHNTIDRLWGKALQQNISTEGKILLASGRLSSEMINKAVKMGVPIVVSRTSPTGLSVKLGQTWNITVIGYARGNSFRVYSVPERVVSNALPGAAYRSRSGQTNGRRQAPDRRSQRTELDDKS